MGCNLKNSKKVQKKMPLKKNGSMDGFTIGYKNKTQSEFDSIIKFKFKIKLPFSLFKKRKK
jgi:hypothetical protein